MEIPNSPCPSSVCVLEQAQHHYFTQTLQGLLPPTINPYQLGQVLDVNCRMGAWAIDLALAYPGITVTALDSDPVMVELARKNAIAGKMTRARFYQADPRSPLHFADNAFDLVHLLLTQLIFRPPEWATFLQECYRILKPGGVINLINVTPGPGSSAAYQRFAVLVDQLMRLMEFSFSDTPGTAAPGVYFCRLLQQAGFTDSTYLLRPVNLGGWDNAGGRACCQLFLKDLLQTKSLLVEHNLISSTEFDVLIEQKQQDIVAVDFCATGALISAFATKR